MRGTQSGGISITNVVVSWSDALGFVNKQFQPIGAYNTLNLPQIQLVFTSFYLVLPREHSRGCGLHQSQHARMAVPAQPRRARHGRSLHPDWLRRSAGQALATASFIESVFAEASAILHTAPRQQVTEEQRAKFAVRVAAAKINAVDVGLAVTSQIYELTGARAVAGKYGFDVAFRDLRTHSLHDPIAHKRAEVGRFTHHGPGKDGWPTPTWYT